MMDCHFSGYCQERPRQAPTSQVEYILRSCGVDLPTQCPSLCCPPSNDHLRPPAGVNSDQISRKAIDTQDYSAETRCYDTSRLACLSRPCVEKFELPRYHCLPIPCANDCLRFSRHAAADRMPIDCPPKLREISKVVQVGCQPMQFIRVEDYDPCPQKKGPNCDCFDLYGTWKNTRKAKQRPQSAKVNRIPLNMQIGVSQEADYDPCPNKKGKDCDCFNPDGTWKDKSKNLPKIVPCLASNRNCGNDCPECPIEIHCRTVYPKCEALVPGYGGHVPGLNVCKFGKTFGRETREALQKVYSTPLLTKSKR